MPSISCIIPAFNEGSRIASVLTAVVDHPLYDGKRHEMRFDERDLDFAFSKWPKRIVTSPQP